MDDPGAQPAYEQAADLDLQILGLLREDALSAELLAQPPSSREGGQGNAGEVLRRLEAMASDGLVRRHEWGDGRGEGPGRPESDRWEITAEGRAFVEPQSGVARAPNDGDVGDEGGGDRKAELWILVALALLTGACAAYTLLTATGVLGDA